MSVYLIIPGLPGSYVKAGKTAKVEETDVTGYLYRRYRTPYGKALIAYIWRCPTDYNQVESKLIRDFQAYKSTGDELFIGPNISQMIFDYCCRQVNGHYIRHQSGLTVKCVYIRGHRIESSWGQSPPISISSGVTTTQGQRYSAPIRTVYSPGPVRTVYSPGPSRATLTFIPPVNVNGITVGMNDLSLGPTGIDPERSIRGGKSTRGRDSTRGGKSSRGRGSTRGGKSSRGRDSTRGRGSTRGGKSSRGRDSTRGGKSTRGRGSTRGKRAQKDESKGWCSIS